MWLLIHAGIQVIHLIPWAKLVFPLCLNSHGTHNNSLTFGIAVCMLTHHIISNGYRSLANCPRPLYIYCWEIKLDLTTLNKPLLSGRGMWDQCDMLFWQGPVDYICIALYICIICWRIHSIYVCKPRSFVMNRPRYRSTMSYNNSKNHFARSHDDVIKWIYFARYWPFMRGIHRSPVNSAQKGQWRGALVCFLSASE